MARNNGAPWTNIDIERVVEMAASGESNIAIAATLGRTASSIATLKARTDVQARITAARGGSLGTGACWPFPTATKPVTKPAAATASRKGQRWNEAEDGELIYGFALGQTPEQLADELNRTVSGVLGRLKEFGLLEFDKDEMAYFVPRKLYRKVT